MESNKSEIVAEQGILQQVSKFLYVLNSKNQVTYASTEAEDILGLTQAEILGHDMLDIISCSCTEDNILADSQLKTLTPQYSASIKAKNQSVQQVQVIEKHLEIENDGERHEGTVGLCILPIELNANDKIQEISNVLIYSRVQYALCDVATKRTDDEVAELSEQVAQAFEKNLQFLNTKDDQWLAKGRTLYLAQASYFIKRDLTIQYVLPAFPFKSNNTEKKVIGQYPDKGEELALTLLVDFIKSINTIYEKGAKLTLVSDGRVFCDIFGILDETVSKYNTYLRQLIPDIDKYVQFQSLEDLLFNCETFNSARDKLLYIYAKSDDAINRKLKDDSDALKIYLGFNKFYLEEFYNFMEHNKSLLREKYNMSRKEMKRDVKLKSKQIMKRNEAYSNMVQDLFPLHIRLSIHAHDNSGPKFAIKLLSSDQVSQTLVSDQNMHIPTPWHNVVVEDLNNKYFLVKKYRITKITDYFELIYFSDGKPSHYKQIKELPSDESL